MKLKYIGITFGIEGLTDGKTYEVIAIEEEYFRIIDDSGEDYLYAINSPSDATLKNKGTWEIVEDDEQQTLKKAIEKYS